MGEYQKHDEGRPLVKKKTKSNRKNVNHAFDRSKNSCHKISAGAPPPKSHITEQGLQQSNMQISPST